MATATGFTNSINSNIHTGNVTYLKNSNCSVCMFAMMSASTGNDQMLWQLNKALSADGHGIYYDNTTTKTLVYEDTNGINSISTIDLILGQWYFIAMSALNANVNVYIKQVGAQTCHVFSATTSVTFGPVTTWIGNDIGDGSAAPWLGSICGVKFWSNNAAGGTNTGIVLSQEEFERESEQIAPIRTADLLYWLPLTGPNDLRSYGINQEIFVSGSAALTQTAGPPLPERRDYNTPPYTYNWGS